MATVRERSQPFRLQEILGQLREVRPSLLRSSLVASAAANGIDASIQRSWSHPCNLPGATDCDHTLERQLATLDCTSRFGAKRFLLTHGQDRQLVCPSRT